MQSQQITLRQPPTQGTRHHTAHRARLCCRKGTHANPLAYAHAARAVLPRTAPPPAAVSLVYVINYGSEVTLPMSPAGNGTYTATIPAAPPGTMVRWYVQATDAQGRTARDPPFKKNEGRQYYGTIVEDVKEKSDLPAFEL